MRQLRLLLLLHRRMAPFHRSRLKRAPRRPSVAAAVARTTTIQCKRTKVGGGVPETPPVVVVVVVSAAVEAPPFDARLGPVRAVRVVPSPVPSATVRAVHRRQARAGPDCRPRRSRPVEGRRHRRPAPRRAAGRPAHRGLYVPTDELAGRETGGTLLPCVLSFLTPTDVYPFAEMGSRNTKYGCHMFPLVCVCDSFSIGHILHPTLTTTPHLHNSLSAPPPSQPSC